MVSVKEEDLTAVNGARRDFSTQEDTVWETNAAVERRIVDSLLDISEESVLKELEPHEYHCYSGWEEAACGWARAAPLSCILLNQKTHKKPKQKEADNPTPLLVDPTPSNADSSSSITEKRGEPLVGLHSSRKLNPRTGFWSPAMVTAQQPDDAKWSALNVMQRNIAHLSLEENIVEEGTLREPPLQPRHLPSKYSMSMNRTTKPQKHSHRPNNIVVPIKNFTFLPPINSPHLNNKPSGYPCRSKRAPEGETLEENCFVLDKKSGGTRRVHIDPPIYSAALTSKYQTCQHKTTLSSSLL
ncbi:uncharacterized protein LOC111572296 [Amphiprion ocellaris]|uniref:uncharacterized protein LOC111572296 n=1 Tax=Amphiprion ocellaris TaxID=80972 RepID=UPI0024113268|nr:uncharacterized protein LOC111572296 [Amphiprion ocellaris]XP_054866917.1 uncharacterized protein LOC111572296 [Amphiprion ocellaris]